MPTKVHAVLLMVVDHDDLGADRVADVIQNVRYPNHCIAPRVMRIDTKEVDFSDEHPLNQSATSRRMFFEMFGPR